MSDSFVEATSNFLTHAVAITGAIAAVVTILAWFFSVRAGRIKDAALLRFQTESRVAIEKANARAEEATRETAQLKVRAATLEKETADARLKYAELQSATAWREFSKEQIATLEKILSGKPSTLRLAVVANDPEAMFVAVQLSKAFTGWKLYTAIRTYPSLVIGLTIIGTSDADLSFVRDAFTAAGISYAVRPISAQGVQVTNDPEGATEPTVEILVGSKPRPEFFKQ
jgi:hypothetical protein